MIECPHCRVSFSPRHAVCPRCQGYEAKLEDRLAFLVAEAEAALEDGVAPAAVQTTLEGEGVSRQQAIEIVAHRSRRVRRAARVRGVKRLAAGLLIVLMAVAFGLAVLPGLPSQLIFEKIVVVSLTGLGLVLFGMRALLSGRD